MADDESDERTAWRALHMEERARDRLRALEQEVQRLRTQMEESMVRQYAEDRGFLRALARYTGHSQYGWEVACGTDGRLKALARNIGWPAMNRLIHKVRRRLGRT